MISTIIQRLTLLLLILIIENEGVELSPDLQVETNKARNPSVTILDLSRKEINLQELREIGKLLKTSLKHIRTLDLSRTDFNDLKAKNLLTELKNTNVNHLELANNVITSSVWKLFAKTLPETNLTTIDLYGNSDYRGLLIKRPTKYSTELILDNSEIEFPGVIPLVKALKDSEFTSLDLSQASLNSLSTSLLLNCLKYTKIHTLKLKNIGYNSMVTLSEQLTATTNFLSISLDDLLSVGSSTLTDILHFLNTKNINLQLETQLTDYRAGEVLERLGSTGINGLTLDFAGYNVNSPVIEAILKILMNLDLETLSILNIQFPDFDFMKMLSETLPQTKLQYLTIDSSIQKDGLRLLSNVLKDTEITSLHFYGGFRIDEEVQVLMKGLIGSKVNYLGLNDFYNDEGFQMMIDYLNQTDISSLSLRDSGFSYDTLEALTNVLPSTSIRELNFTDKVFKKKSLNIIKALKDTKNIHLNLEYDYTDVAITNDDVDIFCKADFIDMKIAGSIRVEDKSILTKLNECLRLNRIKLGKADDGKPLNKINKIHINNEEEVSTTVLHSVRDFIQKIPITEFNISKVQITKGDFDDFVETVSKSNKMLLSLEINQELKNVTFLNENIKSFERAKKVVQSFENKLMEQECFDEDLQSFDMFADTINLWEERKDADELKKKIKLERNRIGEKRILGEQKSE